MRATAIGFCAALAASLALAQDAPVLLKPARWELAILAGYQFEGNLTGSQTSPYASVDVQNTPTYGVALGYNINATGEIEIHYSYARPTAVAIGGRVPAPTFNLGVHQFQFVAVANLAPPQARVRPFLSFGVGFAALNGSPTIQDRVEPAFSISLGVKSYFSETVGWRLEGRWAPTYLYTTGNGSEWCIDYACFNTGDRYLQQFDIRGGVTFRF